MTTHKRLKERLARGWLDYLFSEPDGRFVSSAAFADVAKRAFFEDTEFKHPSLIVSCGKLEAIDPEEAGIFTGQVIFRVTTPMDPVPGVDESSDPQSIHDNRVGELEIILAEAVKEPPAIPGVTLHFVGHSETEEQGGGDSRLFSDLIAIEVFVQATDDVDT